MADDALAKYGLFFDELNKIRVLDPENSQQTSELRDGCKDFTERTLEFQQIVSEFIAQIDAVSKAVEREKLKAIGSRNLLKSVAKQREAQQLELKALITEKRMQLDRLRTQYEALQRLESDQNEFIENFVLQK